MFQRAGDAKSVLCMPIFNKEQEAIGQSNILFLFHMFEIESLWCCCCTGVVKLTNKLNNTPFDASDEEVFQVGLAYLTSRLDFWLASWLAVLLLVSVPVYISYLYIHVHVRPFSHIHTSLSTFLPMWKVFSVFCGLTMHSVMNYEKILKANARQKVALEVLSFHAASSPEEAERVMVRCIYVICAGCMPCFVAYICLALNFTCNSDVSYNIEDTQAHGISVGIILL